MRITHLGHSCLLVEVADQRVLIDPGTFSRPEEVGPDTGVTALVITHQHPDHVDPERITDLVATHPGAVVLAERETAALLPDMGVDADRVQVMVPGRAVALGSLELLPVGERHADIHPYVPKVGNTGVVLRVPGEPVLFHPGDCLDADPGEVDLLCVPVNAPWGKIAETIAFVRRIAPSRGVIPIHDALLSEEPGRPMYLNHITTHGADGGVEVHDLKEAGRQEF